MPSGIYKRIPLKTVEERFWSHVDKNGPNGCWNWIGSKQSAGYGQICLGSRSDNSRHYIYVHRFAYELLKGPIPENLTIDHICRNRACVNPEHLQEVTSKVNILRGNGHTAINALKTHCIHGHPVDLFNTQYRLNGRRRCIICQNINNKKRNRRKIK